jgi:hypothetical protein
VISRYRSDFGRSTWRSNLGEKVNVGLVVLAPLTGKVVFVIDGLNWANRLTCTAVHTLIRVDIEHAIALINTIDRAFVDTSFVFDIYTWKRNYVSH